jgi:hypothetical protein
VDNKTYVQRLNRGILTEQDSVSIYKPLNILGLDSKYIKDLAVNSSSEGDKTIYRISLKSVNKNSFILADGYKLRIIYYGNRALYTLFKCKEGKYICRFTVAWDVTGFFLNDYQIFNEYGTIYKIFGVIGRNVPEALRLNEYRGPYLHGESKSLAVFSIVRTRNQLRSLRF